MDIYESGEDYLERIIMLEDNKGKNHVHAIDLATSFSYSKPSVSLALKKLKENGYLSFDEKENIILSPKGFAKGSAIYERHEILGATLMALGVDKETAYQDACKIEHDISDETFLALKKHYLANKK